MTRRWDWLDLIEKNAILDDTQRICPAKSKGQALALGLAYLSPPPSKGSPQPLPPIPVEILDHIFSSLRSRSNIYPLLATRPSSSLSLAAPASSLSPTSGGRSPSFSRVSGLATLGFTALLIDDQALDGLKMSRSIGFPSLYRFPFPVITFGLIKDQNFKWYNGICPIPLSTSLPPNHAFIAFARS